LRSKAAKFMSHIHAGDGAHTIIRFPEQRPPA
jgi:hypothetical protein